MNFKHIMIVFKKEMKDSFRDKKSVMTNILLPLILIPLMYFCMNSVMKSATKDVEENMKISIISENMELAEEFTKNNIIGEDNIEIVKNTKEEAEKGLGEGEINCILTYSAGFFEDIKNEKASKIEIKYNSLKNTSSLGLQMIEKKILTLNSMLATKKLAQMNISPEILNLIIPEEKDKAEEISNGKKANEFLVMIVPMYLVIIIVTAGIPLAIDIVAGERERNTFEALFSTKANRLSILIGKYLSVLVFSIIAIIMSFLGLIIGIILNPEMFASGSGELINLGTIFSAMNMPPQAMIIVLLSSITLAIAFAGIQIAISTVSRTVKEAQTYLSYLTFPAMIIGFATMFMGAGDMTQYMAYIPIFNTIASLKMVLSGVINYNFLIVGVFVNIVFITIVTLIINNLFKNEKIIIR